VGQVVAPGGVVDDDRLQPRALDDGRAFAVERDADAQRAGAVQELARKRYRERELLVGVRWNGLRRQLRYFFSWPRTAPAGYFVVWTFT
jgi:predicted ATPase